METKPKEAPKGEEVLNNLTKKIKKLNKKLAKIKSHEDSSKEGKPVSAAITQLISKKANILEKLNTYQQLVSSIQDTKHIATEQKVVAPIATESKEGEHALNYIVNFIIAYNIAQMSSEKSLPINIESFLGKTHLESLKSLWAHTFKIPSKFTPESWRKQAYNCMEKLIKKSDEKISDKDITYKELVEKLQNAFKEDAFANVDIEDKEVKVEESKKPIADPVKVTPVEGKKSVETEKKEDRVEKKAEPIHALPSKEVKVDAPKDTKEEPKKKEETKKADDDDDWNIAKESKGKKRGRRGTSRKQY